MITSAHPIGFVREGKALTIRYDSALYDRPEESRARRKAQGFETTANGVDEAKARGLKREVTVDLVVVDVVRDILNDLVGLRTGSALSIVNRRHGTS